MADTLRIRLVLFVLVMMIPGCQTVRTDHSVSEGPVGAAPTPSAAAEPTIARGHVDDPVNPATAPPKGANVAEPLLPAAEPPASDNLSRVRQIIHRADQFNEKYPDFVCRLTRTERVSGSIRTPEVMLMKFRLKPRSVYLKWLDAANEGRECIYVAGKNNGKMVSRGGRGDLLLAGKQLWLDPNGSLARSKSSQPITETGLDVIVRRLITRLEKLEQGDPSVGTLTARRAADPDHPERTYDWIIHDCPPGSEEDMPKGGRHRWAFRTDNGRVELVEATDERGEILYVFRFERYIPVTTLTDDDYDPEKVFPLKQARAPQTDRVAEAEKEVAK